MTHRIIGIPLLTLVMTFTFFSFIPLTVSAETYFKLIPTPTGSCPMNPTTANEKNVSGTKPFDCKNGVCVGSRIIRGGDDLPCNYSLCDFLQLFVNGMNMIVTIAAAIALILLIWGAQGFIMAMGSEEKVTASKGLMKNVALGLVIILVSWQLIAIVISLLVPKFTTLQDQTGFRWDLTGDVRNLCKF